MLYGRHKTNKALRILALLLALLCVFTIVDPAVYAMGQTENEAQTGQPQENEPVPAGGQNDNTESPDGENVSADPDKQPDGENSGTDLDKQPGGENGSADPDKNPNGDNENGKEETDEEEDEDGLTGVSASADITFFAAINGEWAHVYTAASDTWDTAKKRYYITADALEAAYGRYGFSADSFISDLAQQKDMYIFPHTDSNNYNILWADTAPYQAEDGEWRVPISARTVNFVYYLPNNVEGNKTYFTSSTGRDNADVLAENTFYSVSVSDSTGTETGVTGTYYVLRGKGFSIDLSRHEKHVWKVTDMDSGEPVEPSKIEELPDGKLNYTFDSVTQPLKIYMVDDEQTNYEIRYNAATLSASRVQLGEISAAIQTPESNGSIGNADTLNEMVALGEGDEYRLRSPDMSQISASVNGSSKGKKVIYFFDGWRVGNSSTILPADTLLTSGNILRYEQDGVLELTAVWIAKDVNDRIKSVNFYVNLYCEIADNLSNGFTKVPEEDFTKSVYSTGIFGTDNISVSDGLDHMLLAPPDATATAYDTDTTLRTMTGTPYNGVTLESFPSDEEVFRQIRNSGAMIKVEGVEVPSDKLTTEHFKVRWYVLKYEHSDGWHIDGILVAKEGHLRVRKSFLGDSAGIAQITDPQNDFEITVKHTPLTGNAITEDYELTLVPKAGEKREGKLGYSSYDEATRTYEWTLTGNSVDNYTLCEKNYTPGDGWHSSSRYIISGTGSADDDRTWQIYDDTGVITRMESYPKDMPSEAYKTVTFRNTYVRSGILTLYKEDSFTHKGLSGVKFVLSADNGSELALYRKPGTSQYSTNEHASADGYTEEAADGILVTDINGNVYIALPEGSYTLAEEIPTGYNGAAKISFSVDGSGSLTALTALSESGRDVSAGYVDGSGTARLTIKNDSKLLTTVTAETDWADSTPESRRVPVQVELWCNGVRMIGDEYRQTLSAENDWSYVWHDLPLFADGEVAQYTLRERMIGDTAYDPSADSRDGYADYDVTYDSAKYREGDEGAYNDKPTWVDGSNVRHYANHVLLRSHNSLDNGLVDVNVTKQWSDDDNRDGIRPGSVTVKLFCDGEDTGRTLTLSAANRWNGEFRELRAYTGGKQHVYTVEEVSVPGYTATITQSQTNGFNIMNIHTPETLTVSGTKTWAGDEGHEAARPESIKVILLAGGEPLAEQTANNANNWSWSFENLPKYSAGEEIVYTVSEVEVKGYTAEVKGYDIINHYRPEVKPTPTPTPTPTVTPTPTPTATPTPTPTATASPVPTTIPTDSPAPSYTPRPTPTPRPTAKPGTDPKTGDESNIALWAGMGLVSIAAAAGAVLLIKKHGKGK